MKKILLSLTMVLAIVALASCSLTPQTTIEFSSLPETVYEAGEYTDAEVEAFLEKVSVKVTGIQEPIKLTNELVTVSGFDKATLKTPGSYTLVVLFDSASVVFSYTVIAKETPQLVKNAEEFQAALNNGGIIELTADIETAKRFKITKSVVVYGNGHKVLSTESNGSTDGRAFDMDSVSNVKVSLNNLNVEATGLRGFSAYNCKNLEITLNNCTVKAANYAFNLASFNDGLIVNINETTLQAYGAINIWSNNAEINVYKSVLKSEDHNGETFGNIVLNGGARDYNNIGLKAGDTGQNNTINLVETEIIVNDNKVGNPYVVLVQDYCSGNVINFEGCTFTYREGNFYKPDSYLPAANEVNVDGVRK
ncbi:MAG: hypothetical protein IKT40_10285 [Bacilli bacterium]|nr:hypothetical protein [Bacilli bacterium]